MVTNDGVALYKKGFDYRTGKPWHIPEVLELATKKEAFYFTHAAIMFLAYF